MMNPTVAPFSGLSFISRLLLSMLIAASLGCARATKNYPTLSEKGIIALSTTNAYLGPNLFLGQELEKSTYLFNFFKYRGAPAAIELVEPTFSSTRMFLYYPLQKELYAADFMEQKGRREWIVSGPFAIERTDYRNLARIESTMVGEPVFMLYGKQHRFRFEQESIATAQVLKPSLPEYAPTPPPAKKKSAPKAPKAEQPLQPQVVVGEPAPSRPPVDMPLTADQQALMALKGIAPRADNGDVIHIVKSDSESLEKIAQWYTGSSTNAATIASNSGIKSVGALMPGIKIRIPALLVKETRVMP